MTGSCPLSHEIVPINGIGIAFQVQRVPVSVASILPNPQAGNDTPRAAVSVLLFEAYRAMRVIGGFPRPLVAYIEAMRVFPVEEHGFEPVEVVGSGFPSTHDVFEDYAVAAPCIFELCHNGRNIGFVLDKAMAGLKRYPHHFIGL